MIKANDLRIGNYIWNPVQQCYTKVNLQVLSNIISDDYYKRKNEYRFQEIELTDEILLKCGFNRNHDEYELEGFIIEEAGCGEYYYTAGEGVKLNQLPIQYLHALQNWYYLYQGDEELEIKL